MSDFKQQVEEILHHCDREEKCGWPYCDSCDYRVDRILAAHNARLDEIARLKKPTLDDASIQLLDRHERETYNEEIVGFNAGVEACQAYIQAQKGS